jgi:RNA polymerase sigma-70 factor (ECF subfamily)
MRDESNRARLLDANDITPPARTACDERTIGHDLLRKLVRELDEAHCEVLAYRYLDDMTQDEIAELLGLSRKTIGKRLDRIREAVTRIADASPGAAS